MSQESSKPPPDGFASTDNVASKKKVSAVAGRKGDPRMNRSVSIREANPAMSLLDALRAGGFVFPALGERTDENSMKSSMIEDTDGVKLSQRKNQLIRRLRVARRKRDGGIDGKASNDGIDIPGAVSSQAHFISSDFLSSPINNTNAFSHPDFAVSTTGSQSSSCPNSPMNTNTLQAVATSISISTRDRERQSSQAETTASILNEPMPPLQPTTANANASLSRSFGGLTTDQNLTFPPLGYQPYQTQPQPYLKATRRIDSSYAPFLNTMNANKRFSNTNAFALFRDQESQEAISNLLQSAQAQQSLIHSSKYHKLYCLSSGPTKVAVKVMEKTSPETVELENFHNEFELTKNIKHEGIRKVLTKTVFMEKPALLMEWFEAENIKEFGKFSIKEFLKAAREITSALAALHSEGVMHNNLIAENILYNRRSRTVKIIGFSSSSRFSIKNSFSGYRNLNQNMNYAPPETLCRPNRLIDFRADFYSLGVLFYFMITGNFPFQSNHKSVLLRKHIFDAEEPLHNIDSTIPRSLSDFVSRLMRKKADERYQSAKGILYDLELMLSEYNTDTQLKSIQLMQHDFSENFLPKQKLYGRELESSLLLSIFNEVKKEGAELVLIRGVTGSGKSALAFDLYRPVIEHNGIFVTGKYDQSQTKVPYSALIRACDNYCELLLEEDEENLIRHRRQIQEALGEEANLLTSVIPNLHLVIGPQPQVINTIGKESKSRFNYVFCKFLNIISSTERPLVIFIDDMQWADCDSMLLLSTLFTQKEQKKLISVTKGTQNLLIVGTYRENEATDDLHPLNMMLREMKEKHVTVKFIHVAPIGMANVNEMISDALHCTRFESYSLTSLVLKKTHGNPFFVVQFLRLLFELKLVQFSHTQKKWIWDADDIEKQNLTDNVVQFLIDKLMTLDGKTQKCLLVASCIGDIFSLSTLELANSNYQALESGLSNGLVVPANVSRDDSSKNQYQFAHDQIQSAATALIPVSELDKFRFQLGRKLWKNSTEAELCDNIYITVNLLNFGLETMRLQNFINQEAMHIARLNLKAGEKAKLSASYKLASWYFTTGIAWAKVLESESSTSSTSGADELFFRLYSSSADAHFCLSNYDLMEKMIEEGLKWSASLLTSTSLISLRIRALSDQHYYDKCIDDGMDILRKLGESFVSEVDDEVVESEYNKLHCLLEDKSNDEITKQVVTDNATIAKCDILNTLFVPCYNKKPGILPLITLRNVQLSLQHGVSSHSAFAFASLGNLLCGSRDEFREGFRFGQLAVKLLEQFEAKDCLPKVYTCVFMCINHWIQHIHNSIDPLLDSYRIGLEVGCHDFAFHGANGFCMYSLISGKPLEKLLENLTIFDSQLPSTAKGFKFESCYYTCQRFSRNVPAKSTNMKVTSSCDNDLVMGCFHFMFLSYFFKDYVMAKEWQTKCAHLLSPQLIFGTHHMQLFEFYNALLALALVGESTVPVERAVQSTQKSVEKIKKWCKYSPENFENKLYLLQAEIAAVQNEDAIALEYYEKAIIAAKRNSFIHEEALACERAGYYHRKNINRVEKGTELLFRSYLLYSEWGATNKARQLEQCDIFSTGQSESRSQGFPSSFLLEHQSPGVSKITRSYLQDDDDDNEASSKRSQKRKLCNPKS